MDITPKIPSHYHIIDGYGPNNFLINETKYFGNLIVYKTFIKQWSSNIVLAELDIELFAQIIEHRAQQDITEPAVILLGYAQQFIIPFKLKHGLSLKNLNIDVMTTGAACRTYNILLSEGREVYAALIAI